MKKKDRCREGKPCGLACINRFKKCRKGLAESLSIGLGKTAIKIDGGKGKGRSLAPTSRYLKNPSTKSEKNGPTESQLKEKANEHLRKLKRAAISATERTYTNNLNKHLEYKKMLRDMGVKVSDRDPPTWEKIAVEAKALRKAIKRKIAFDKVNSTLIINPKYNNFLAQIEKVRKVHERAIRKASEELRDAFLGKSGRLSPLRNESDFLFKERSSRGYYSKSVEDSHKFIRRFLGPIVGLARSSRSNSDPERELALQKLRDSLLKGMTKSQVQDGLKGIELFTGYMYSKIRNAQNGRKPSDYFSTMGKAIDNLISRQELDKPNLEKFRGVAVTTDRLNDMVAGSKIKGTFRQVATSSWSSDLSVSRNFADQPIKGEASERVIFRAVNKKGVPIESLTTERNEYEIITPSNVNYRYIKYRPITIEGDKIVTYHVFDVEEM